MSALKCQVCNKKFPDKDLLDNHQELEHMNFWTKKHAEKLKKVSEKREKIKGEFQCEFCEKTFEYQKTLKAHMFSHTGNWPYSCDICGKGVSSKYNLDRHRLQVHTKEYKFKCEVCGNKFFDNYELMKHYKARHLELYEKIQADKVDKEKLVEMFKINDFE